MIEYFQGFVPLYLERSFLFPFSPLRFFITSYSCHHCAVVTQRLHPLLSVNGADPHQLETTHM